MIHFEELQNALKAKDRIQASKPNLEIKLEKAEKAE